MNELCSVWITFNKAAKELNYTSAEFTAQSYFNGSFIRIVYEMFFTVFQLKIHAFSFFSSSAKHTQFPSSITKYLLPDQGEK